MTRVDHQATVAGTNRTIRYVLAAVVVLIVLSLLLLLVGLSRLGPGYQVVSIAMLRDESRLTEWLGELVEIEGVVAGDFRQPGQYGGCFLQQLDSPKLNPRPGIFVHCGPYQPLELGDVVSARGIVAASDNGIAEIVPEPQYDSVTVEVLSHDPNLAPMEVSLGDAAANWDNLHGALVRIPEELIVVDTYDWARYGQLTLAAKQRLYIPTNSIDPNDEDPTGNQFEGNSNIAKVRAAEQHNQQRTLILDDGYDLQNPAERFLAPSADHDAQSLRLGSTLTGLEGIVTQWNGRPMLLPVGKPKVRYAARPPRPDLGDPRLTIASFNVLNYFTTIDDGSNGARGADSDAELDRQRKKLTAALLALDADILGLMELENNLAAEQDLVRALNEQLENEVYAGVGLPQRFAEYPGADNTIRVAILYRKDRVTPVGPVDAVVDTAFTNARTPLVQKFRVLENKREFRLIVNHFKSKGSRDAKGADRDQRDGQAAYNASRRQQAAALIRYIESLDGDENQSVLVVGDLNAYAQEDPIDALRGGGMVDLLHRDADRQQPFTFVYRGQAGCLDHALATPELAAQVTAAKVWHLNACEPRCNDYNTEHRPPDWFQPDPFRSSDHDPVLIGLDWDD